MVQRRVTLTTTPSDSYFELETDAQDLLFRSARTANAVTDEQVRAIHDLVRWGPTGMNAQPLRVLLVRTPDARGRLVEHMNDGNKAKTSIAPLTLVLAADVDFHDELPRVSPHAVGARDRLHADEDARERMAKLNALLQAAYLIVGIRAAGLAAGPMTGFDAAAVDADFFPDGRHRSLVVVNVGHAAPDAYRERSPRLEYEDVVTSV